MPLENLDDLEAAWAEFMHDRKADDGSDLPRREWSQDQRWRTDNPGKQEKLQTYYDDRTARPNEFDDAERGSPEKRMVEILDALWDAKGAVEPPPPPPPVKSLIQTIQNGTKLSGRVDWTAVYDGNADDVPDDPGSIHFFLDGQDILTENTPPFGNPTGFWDSTSVDDGNHTFQVKAFDESGNLIIESEVATAEVDNAVVPPPPPPGARLVAQADYTGYADVGDVPLWKPHGEQVKADDRLTIVNDPLGQRGKVARNEVRPGDNNVAGSGNGERAEVMCSAETVQIHEGKILSVSMAILLPNDFQSNSSGWNVWAQMHDTSSGSQSPVQSAIINGNQMMLRLWGGPRSGGGGTYRSDHGPYQIPKGKWCEIVWAFAISAERSKARTVVAIDGAVVLDKRDQPNLYTGSKSYWKEGFYRVAQPNVAVHYRGPTRFYNGDSVEAVLAAAMAN